ncbi:MAG: sulfite exporter TauE/SafE family protein, partial [Candidatus Omnitrophota bacterium]|nr:sulfite exporter TauE/SafE family protein [Candidatus Omnitrophota bacterium]
MESSFLQIILIPLTAFVASCLTFFSGFGLGTILMPVFLIFFPLQAAIALTAVVHFWNNILKLALLWKNARWDIVLRFGLPAFLMAFVGAKVLFTLEKIPVIYTYFLFDQTMSISIVKLTIAFLIIIFVLLEMLPQFQSVNVDPKFLPLGGTLSGFFGGL